MAKPEDKKADLCASDTTKRFTDVMHKLLAVPKEDMPRRETEWQKAYPKKAKRKDPA